MFVDDIYLTRSFTDNPSTMKQAFSDTPNVMKQGFHGFQLMHYAYELLRCLEVETFVVIDQTTDKTDCFFPCTHTWGRKILDSQIAWYMVKLEQRSLLVTVN